MRRPPAKTTQSRRAFVAATGSALAVCLMRAPAPAAQFSWKFGSAFREDHPTTIRLVDAFEKIRVDTKGELDIKPYLNSVLGGDAEMIRQLRLGALEMLLTGGGTINTIVPQAMIESTAYAFRNTDLAHSAMDGDLGKAIRSEFPAKGFYGFDKIFEYGYRNFTTSTKPIRVASDIEGLKLRVSPGKLYFDTLKSFGANPTTLNLNEIYSALQTHIVDGQETPLWAIYDTKVFEVQKYCSLTRHMWSALYGLVNKEKWDSLPRNFQEVATRHINAAALLERQDNVASDRGLQAKMEARGLVFNEADTESLKAKLRSTGFYQRWHAEYGNVAWTALEKYSGKLS